MRSSAGLSHQTGTSAHGGGSSKQAAGRGFDGSYGQYVHLDLRHLGAEVISKRLPMVRELTMTYVGVDPITTPIPVRPVVHYMMGGIHTDVQAATPLAGLYAAGEAACVSINGSNRLGSNSLTECLVFGARAGIAAARFAREHPQLGHTELAAQASDEEQRIARQFIRAEGGTERIATLRAEMHQAMEAGAGIYREAASLQETCDQLARLRALGCNLAQGFYLARPMPAEDAFASLERFGVTA